MGTQRQLVLVVDDDQAIRDFMALTLTDEGYYVLTADDGLEALDIATRNRPALILLDMYMPNLDGLGFIEAYHQLPGVRARIVMLTAEAASPELMARWGVDDILEKPFALDALLDLVSSHLSA